jgi:hypothetical protein
LEGEVVVGRGSCCWKGKLLLEGQDVVQRSIVGRGRRDVMRRKDVVRGRRY